MYISTKICEFVHHMWQYEPNTTLSSYLVCHLVLQETHHNITELLLKLADDKAYVYVIYSRIFFPNGVGGVIVCMLISGVVGCGCGPRWGQTKDYYLVFAVSSVRTT